MLGISSLQQAIDVVEALPLEDQELLVELLKRRIIERRRAEIARNADITLQAVREGKARYGTVTDIKIESHDEVY
jgi:hypothetical protein